MPLPAPPPGRIGSFPPLRDRAPVRSLHEPRLVTLTRTFRSSRTFHPSYSLLGRAFRRWMGDRLRSEALFIVTVSGLVLGLLMLHYLGWALLQPVMKGPQGEDWQIGFWIGQLVSVGLVTGLGLIGFRPALHVSADADTLTLEQGSAALRLDRDRIEEVRTIPATTYHQHYRHYRRTRVFAGRPATDVLLLVTPDGPVIVALESLTDLMHLYEHLTEASPEPAETRAAA